MSTMSKADFVRSITARSNKPSMTLRDWIGNHNRALQDWERGMIDHRDEVVVLNLAYAIWTLCESDWVDDGYVEPNVTVPVMQGFHDLLNISLGRLDGGTLSSWLVNLATVLDIEEVL